MAKKNRKIMISCAINGAVHAPTMPEHLPTTPTQIVDRPVGAARHVERVPAAGDEFDRPWLGLHFGGSVQ
jgi:hypothetical protein